MLYSHLVPKNGVRVLLSLWTNVTASFLKYSHQNSATDKVSTLYSGTKRYLGTLNTTLSYASAQAPLVWTSSVNTAKDRRFFERCNRRVFRFWMWILSIHLERTLLQMRQRKKRKVLMSSWQRQTTSADDLMWLFNVRFKHCWPLSATKCIEKEQCCINWHVLNFAIFHLRHLLYWGVQWDLNFVFKHLGIFVAILSLTQWTGSIYLN